MKYTWQFFQRKIASFVITLVLTLIFILNSVNLFFASSLSSRYLNQIGNLNWILSYLLITIFSLFCLIKILQFSFKKKKFFSLLALSVLISLALYESFQLRNVSHETTQQVACVLNEKYFGEKFNSSCFLGYPARQYLIQALPSFALGRSVFSLNLGGLLYFIPAILIFIASYLKFNKNENGSEDRVIGIGIMLLLQFHYLNHFLFHFFEQSIFPLSLGFLNLGLLNFYKDNHDKKYLLLFVISLQHLIFAYTPALALVPLLIAFLLYINLKKERKIKNILAVVIVILITLSSFLVSGKYRTDIRIFKPDRPKTLFDQTSINDIQTTITHLFIKPQGVVFAQPFIMLMLISFMLLISFKNRFHFLVLFWAITTIIISTQSNGYNFYGLDFRAHRVMVVIPVFIYYFVLFFTKIFKSKKSSQIINFISVFMMLFLIIFGLKNNRLYMNTQATDDRTLLSLWLQKNISSTQPLKIYIIDPKPYQDFISINDKLQYFQPQLKAIITSQTEYCFYGEGVYITDQSSSCYPWYQRTLIKHGEEFIDTKNHRLSIFYTNNY